MLNMKETMMVTNFLEGHFGGSFDCKINHFNDPNTATYGHYSPKTPGHIFINMATCTTPSMYMISLIHEYTHLMQHEHGKFFSTKSDSLVSLYLYRSERMCTEDYEGTYHKNPMECDAVLASLFISWKEAKANGKLEDWKEVAPFFLGKKDAEMMLQLAAALSRENFEVDNEKYDYAECCYDLLDDLA